MDTADNFKRTAALRGMTRRARRLLGYEQRYAGTAYDHLQPWDAPDGPGGVPVACADKRPSILLGLGRSRLDRLHNMLVGADAFPTLVGADEALVDTLLIEMDLSQAMTLPVLDLLVKGSGAFAIHRPGGRFIAIYLDTAFAEPLFASQARSARAKAIAEELKSLGVTLPAPAPGEHLAVPEGAEPGDVIFVRYQFPFDDEAAENEHGEGAGETSGEAVRWVRRRDYLPNVILEYRDQSIAEGATIAGDWELSERPKPHNWGVVPVIWGRSPGARPEEPDGPSFFTPFVLSLEEAADYTASAKDDSVRAIAWPQEYGIDVEDVHQALADEMGTPAPTSSSSKAVRQFQSIGGAGGGSVGVFEVSGSGPQVASDHLKELSDHASRLTGIADHDPERVKGALSGTAMERLEAPAVARVKAYRGAVARMLYSAAYVVARIQAEAEPDGLVVRWGAVFPTTSDDVLAWASALVSASGGPVVSRESAVARMAQVLELGDAEEELKRIDAGQDRAVEAERTRMAEAEQKAKAEAEAAAAKAGAADDKALQDAGDAEA